MRISRADAIIFLIYHLRRLERDTTTRVVINFGFFQFVGDLPVVRRESLMNLMKFKQLFNLAADKIYPLCRARSRCSLIAGVPKRAPQFGSEVNLMINLYMYVYRESHVSAIRGMNSSDLKIEPGIFSVEMIFLFQSDPIHLDYCDTDVQSAVERREKCNSSFAFLYLIERRDFVSLARHTKNKDNNELLVDENGARGRLTLVSQIAAIVYPFSFSLLSLFVFLVAAHFPCSAASIAMRIPIE